MSGDHKESFKKDGCDLQVQELLLTSGRKRSVPYSSPAAPSAVGALFFDAFVKETKQACSVILSPSSVILSVSEESRFSDSV
jgi:hypothetical protein